MVNLVEDWKDIEVYTRRLSHDVKTGSYQLRKARDVLMVLSNMVMDVSCGMFWNGFLMVQRKS